MSTPELRVSPDLALPQDAITQSIALLAVKRAGKALALDTPLPTPSGWTAMGDVRVGDVVFDEAGHECRVTDAWPTLYGRPCFEVVFSDGSRIVADAEHQWYADTRRSRRRYGHGWFNNIPADIVTTQVMAAGLKAANGVDSNYSVSVAAPLKCADADLPIPPYTLGAWLGDGATATGSVTSADSEIIDEIEREGETTWVIPSTVKADHASYRVKGLQPRLRLAGVLGNKHIPAAYLRASEFQRRALLAGLLDTDGYASKRGHIEFCSTRERLARDVHHLVATLGYKPTLRNRRARLYGKDCGTMWTVGFRSPDKVFRLTRKVGRQTVAGPVSGRRFVVAVHPVASVPVRCIAVDSPNHLYLVGETCIPTHNSNAAAVMAEEMYHAGLPWVAIDPKGDWWGLRSDREGTGPGLPIPIFGGLHGDMPLVPEAGQLIADLIVERNLTCILDVSEWDSEAQQMRFLTDFAKRLFRLHGRHPQPRHLFLEEADEFIPQVVRADQAPCVGAWSKLVKQGGQRGLGVTIISQRSAVVNKNALSQCDTLMALRTTGPQDRKAISDWVSHHNVAREIVDSLPGLQDGEAWVCSPHWLAKHGLQAVQRIRFRQRATFDSGATPTMELTSRPPATLADIDLGDLAGQMEAVAEKAAQDDPRALRRRITDLERQLARGSAPCNHQAEIRVLRREVAAANSRPPDRVEVPVFTEGDIRAIEVAATMMTDATEKVAAAVAWARAAEVPPARPAAERIPAPVPAARKAPAVPAAGPAAEPAAVGELALGKAHRAILAVLAQFPEGRTRTQLGLLSGYSVKSSGFGNALGALRSAGLVNRGQPIQITPEGLAVIGDDWEPLPAGDALATHWMRQLSKAERAILTFLLDAWPEPVTRDELAAGSGYSASSSGFGNALGRLRSLDLVNRGQDITVDETFAREVGRG